MNIRIIYDYDLKKLKDQYSLIKNLFPKHELLIYNNYKDTKIKDLCDINIYIDTVNEPILFSTPSKINILIVNDEYIIKNKYVRREFYYDKPLILIDSVINYYFCLTTYSYNYLIKNNIDKKKIYLFTGLINNKSNKNLLMNKNLLSKENKIYKEDNYILYEIDLYSQQDNIKILEVWLKYFLDKPIKLIIKYIYEKEDIITLFKEKINVHKLLDNNIYFYKNIIVFKDDKFLNKYKKDVKLVFLNHSNFSIVYDLYIHILNQKYIITINNDITRELLDKSQLYDKFDEINIYNILNNYFNMSSNIHMNNNIHMNTIKNNKNKLEEKIKKTNIELSHFFKNLHF
jgi:hypothetical protein